VKRGTKRVSSFRFVAVFLILVIGLLLGDPPQAAFTIGPSTAGQAPFEVTLSAALSSDPDGDIETYAWDFGDGTSGAGLSVSHTYTEAGTYTITLVVTDSAGQTDRTSKTVYVTPPEPPGPTASFTASPGSGTSPLSVRFDASASTYTSYPLTYTWDFGDGGSGSGVIVSHLYIGAGTYTVTLIVRGPDGKEGTATGTVTVNAPGGTAPAGSPSARFDIDDNTGVAPHRAQFDPADSEAAEGRTISTYTWSFGDGTAESTINAAVVTHVFTTADASKTFSVTLVVIDNEGATDSMTKTVKVENYQPVAGFEILDTLGINGGAQPAGDWVADDVVYNNVQSATTTVWIRSQEIVDANWLNLDHTAPVPATKTGHPDEYADHNMCYDPEGQTWDNGTGPDWFPNRAWGIKQLRIDWGDGNIDIIPFVDGGDTVAFHPYAFPGTTLVKTITVTAIDYLGAESSYQRTVTLNAGSG